MKRNPSFMSWWSELGLQPRLVLVFTGLVSFSVIVLSLFLYSNVHMVAINNRARTVFEQNRQVYNLSAMTQKYDLAVNQYGLNANGKALIELEIQSSRIDETVNTLRSILPEEDQTNLDQFAGYKQQADELFTQITVKVDEEDWASVNQLMAQANDILEPMYNEIEVIGDRGQMELVQVLNAVDRFYGFDDMITILALPAFLLLAGFAALLIYLQINQPLEQLTQAAKGVLDRNMDKDALNKLAARRDEIAYMAKEFITMDSAVDQRIAQLNLELEEIRGKIR